MHDVRLALRLIVTHRWFSAAVVVTLALGIGINTAAFTLVNAVLFKPLPFAGGDRIVAIGLQRPAESGRMNLSRPDFLDYRSQATSFEAMEAAAIGAATLSEPGVPAERYRLAQVTSGFFRLVRIEPILGRGFVPADETPGAEGVVVLSSQVWRNRYAASPEVVGRQVRVNERAATVIGVMPDGFRLPNREDLWIPLMPAPAGEKRDARNLVVIGLLKRGVSIAGASADLDVVASRLEAAYPDTNRQLRARAETFHERFNGGEVRIVFLLMLGAVGLVLLVACANVANMMLGRALTRHREMSVRIALGASRWRLVRQLLVESLLLSVTGSLLGLGLAKAGVLAFDMAVANSGKPSWVVFAFDYRVLGYCTALCLLAGVVFGLAPALRSSRADPNHSLKEGGRTGSGRGHRLASVLVVSQFTLALVLLAAAGLLVRSLVASRVINGDMPRQQILTARVALPSERYPDRAAQHRFFEEVLGRLAALPGATGAALMTQAPGLGSGSRRIEIEGAPLTNPAESPSVPALNVSPGYFHMFDLTIGRGRRFDDRDGPPGREVAIVTPEFVRRYLANEDPIGRRFRLNTDKQPGPWMTIVGVSGDLVQGQQGTRPEPVVFVPFRQEDAGSLLMAVRTSGDASRLTAGLRSAIQQIDLDLALFDVRTLQDAVEQSRLFFRVFAGVFSIFGVMALLMAAIGLYAVMAQATARRTREIGIRMALGATPSRILTTVMRRGVVQIAVGLVLGLSLALATADTMRTLLFGIVPRDPAAFTAAAGVLVAAGLLACWLPAWRAARLPPVYALTQEER